MNKRQKKIIQIAAGAALYIAGMIFKDNKIAEIVLFSLAYAITGFDALWKAVRNLFHGHLFDENFLMTLATIGAFAIGEYPEGVAVMWLYQVGEFFQDYAVTKSRKSIADLMDIRPDTACVKRNGEYSTVDPEEVQLGETILVKAGDRVPLDGIILTGKSRLDTSMLTGEALPVEVSAGQEVISGCVNLNGTIEIQTTKSFEESTVSKILDLVENASNKKGTTEKFISRFAKYYTPCVVFAAILIAVLPPLFIQDAAFRDWIYRALVFLMVSCPCALVISIPLGFFAGIGAASKKGILVKGGNYLEQLSNVEIVVFDKTGTLTKADFVVTKINNMNVSEDELLKLAASAEKYSTHPIGIAVVKAFNERNQHNKSDNLYDITDISEEAGFGISAVINGKQILAGNKKLLQKYNIEAAEVAGAGTAVYIAYDGKYAGNLLIEDEIKPDAKQAIQSLKEQGIKKTVMLTGDREETAASVAEKIGIDEYHAKLLPADKVTLVEKMLGEKAENKKLAFVGDGINDAPVLARADIGIAMGGLGSDAAIEAADIVIMTDEPSKISTAMKISKKTLRLVKQNIVFALTVKGIVLVISAFGFANMWEAVIVDVGVSLLAVLNSIRALK